MTDAKMDMVMAAMPPVQRWIVRQVEDNDGPLRFDLVSVEEIMQACDHLPETMRRSMTDKNVIAGLRAADAKQLGQVRLGGRGEPRVTLWSIRNHEVYAGMTPSDLRAAYLIDRKHAADQPPKGPNFEPPTAPEEDPRLSRLLN